jgi:ribosomal protein S12 methylthiotransferase
VKVNLTTLGCPKNIVDSEFLVGGLRGEGIEFVSDPGDAETIILNTCGFIQGAKEESIDAILQAVALKKDGICRRVFVTGCLSQRYQDDLKKTIPEVDGYYGNRDMQRILQDLTCKLDLKRAILGERFLSTPPHYAYLKISEGCENPCTFCAIPGIRGRFRSRPVEALLAEAELLAAQGVRELIVVAQDTTFYGVDLYGERRLVQLLDKLTAIQGFKWIRLMYTYPAHFSEALIEIIADRRDVIKYVDMPIQHCSDRILKAMARKTRRRQIETIIERLRLGHPDIAIRTSLIVGFPGETEQDQHDLRVFVEDMQFQRLGVFAYSKEEDTPAYHFSGHVEDYVIQERWAEIHDVQNQVSLRLNQKLIGTVQELVVESMTETSDGFVGRTAWDCPEIDNAVIVDKMENITIGSFHPVRITGCRDYEVQAQFLAPRVVRPVCS